ncbi:MAG: hypothetical protein KAS04_00955 [Candidatus Aenigmarchaeota archaeon]|nr:hypothetical protein [Candidatus Aenigmarchaeota archaeon]
MSVDYGKIFGHALRYPLRKDVFTLMFVINLFFSVVSWIVTNATMGNVSAIDETMALSNIMNVIVFTIPMAIIFFAISVFIMPIFVDNSRKFFKGKNENPTESISIAKERFIPLLLTMFLVMLILFACFSVIFIPIITATFLGQAIFAVFAGVLSIIGIVVVAYIMFMLILSSYICIIEKTGAQDSIKSSWRIVGKNKLNTFIFIIIFTVIYIAIYLLMLVPSLGIMILQGNYTDFSVTGLVILIITTILGSYSALFTMSATTNYYLTIKPKLSMKSILKKK